jgi:hypothetical protein
LTSSDLAPADRKVGQLLEEIRAEARTANDVIALGRDGKGNGRVKVATAMHRIVRFAEEASSALAAERSEAPADSVTKDEPTTEADMQPNGTQADPIDPATALYRSLGVADLATALVRIEEMRKEIASARERETAMDEVIVDASQIVAFVDGFLDAKSHMTMISAALSRMDGLCRNVAAMPTSGRTINATGRRIASGS